MGKRSDSVMARTLTEGHFLDSAGTGEGWGGGLGGGGRICYATTNPELDALLSLLKTSPGIKNNQSSCKAPVQQALKKGCFS